MKEKFTFKSLREIKRLDVVFLARQFEVSVAQIKEIEQDSSEISDKLVEKYLRFFGVLYDEIYFGRADEVGEERTSCFSHPLKEVRSLSKESPRFILAYFFVKTRACRSCKLFWLIYLLCQFMPFLLGYFVFQELPANGYGYFYSWTSNLIVVLMMLSLWRNVERNYLETNQKTYFELLERHFSQVFLIFLPAFLAAMFVFVFNFPHSNAYFLTNCLTMVPLSLNFFSIGFTLFLIFLPIVVVDYPIRGTLKTLYPKPAIVFCLLFLLTSPLADLIYGSYENLGIFYINTCLLLMTGWAFYLLFGYRLHLSSLFSREHEKLRYKWKVDGTFIFLLSMSLICVSFFAFVYLGIGQIVFTSKQTFDFIPFLFELVVFSCMFILLKRQALKLAR